MNGDVWQFSSCQAPHARSAAVANTGWLLAKYGARVLLVDWDLDERILHTFFEPYFEPTKLAASAALAGLLSKIRAAAQADTDTGTPNRLRDLAVANQTVRINGPFQAGTLDLLPAGREDPWLNKLVASTDWNDVLSDPKVKQEIENLSTQLRAYDYALINHGSGWDGATKLSTMMSPDVNVMCFALTDQAIEKAAEVVGVVAPPHVHATGQSRILPVPVRLRNPAAELKLGREHARRVFRHLPTGLNDSQRDRYWKDVEVEDRMSYTNDLVVVDRGTKWRGEQAHAYERLVSVLTWGVFGG